MYRTRLHRVLSGLVVSVIFWLTPGGSASAVSDTSELRVLLRTDRDNGRYVFEICGACHLPEAWGNRDGTYPQLAGQHPNVLLKQLVDIREGRRDNPIMYPFVQSRTIGDHQSLADVVAYVSALPMQPDHGRGPWDAASVAYATGRTIYRERCRACHGESGEGNNDQGYPRLHGQHHAYVLRQLQLVNRGVRHAEPAMTAAVQSLSEEEIAQVANYLSHLPVPPELVAPNPDWRNPDFD